MTMAKVENNSVTQVGLPDDLKSYSLNKLRSLGWHKVLGTDKPTDPVEPGYRYEYGAEWSAQDDVVYGTWQVKQRPQPYPSWSWVDGEGWVAPVAKPDDGQEYVWDEESGGWVEEEIVE